MFVVIRHIYDNWQSVKGNWTFWTVAFFLGFIGFRFSRWIIRKSIKAGAVIKWEIAEYRAWKFSQAGGRGAWAYPWFWTKTAYRNYKDTRDCHGGNYAWFKAYLWEREPVFVFWHAFLVIYMLLGWVVFHAIFWALGYAPWVVESVWEYGTENGMYNYMHWLYVTIQDSIPEVAQEKPRRLDVALMLLYLIYLWLFWMYLIHGLKDFKPFQVVVKHKHIYKNDHKKATSIKN